MNELPLIICLTLLNAITKVLRWRTSDAFNTSCSDDNYSLNETELLTPTNPHQLIRHIRP